MNNSIGNKIAAFHIGRGGKFNNPGFMKFLGLRDLTSFSSFVSAMSSGGFGTTHLSKYNK